MSLSAKSAELSPDLLSARNVHQAARNASKFHCQRAARAEQARDAVRKTIDGFEYCVPLIEAQGLLSRLSDISKNLALLEGLALSPNTKALLRKAAQDN